jgi:hypothetical protein
MMGKLERLKLNSMIKNTHVRGLQWGLAAIVVAVHVGASFSE